uniref:Uncharacterized protein n=1 Tax=Rhizophora mucronata TaxID=61149 RepID=A0A2P2N662_RHIMU
MHVLLQKHIYTTREKFHMKFTVKYKQVVGARGIGKQDTIKKVQT